MKTFFLSLFSILTLASAQGASAQELVSYKQLPAGAYTLDKTHAHLLWSVNHFGLSDYVGRFSDFDVTVNFDPADVEKSQVNVTIDPLSLTTPYPYPEKTDFNKELQGEQWINAAKFPQISFVSTSLKMEDEDEGKLTGDLTFMGVTKSVTLDVDFNGAYMKKPFADVPAMGFSAEGSFKRSDFGLMTYVPNVGDEVDLEIEVELHKAP